MEDRERGHGNDEYKNWGNVLEDHRVDEVVAGVLAEDLVHGFAGEGELGPGNPHVQSENARDRTSQHQLVVGIVCLSATEN